MRTNILSAKYHGWKIDVKRSFKKNDEVLLKVLIKNPEGELINEHTVENILKSNREVMDEVKKWTYENHIKNSLR
ncbi:hypothetical protein SAMN04487895_101539 [Paenibacillus sophorae]|uniref:Uncharacterized protein n=1 Tax=Paenibacillus sophorae TaxID=1333845 RepID=A0A1H8GLB8_9BACL|nr:hypothetical protein [Paenibacillus sophorae]QWU14247.1 hypothetical protein KP014_20265 [Paenibacillus sophorae]SEN44098.1 hypothetical protein SAMN04487895_101539 [Paenibacillus sophorae]